MNEAIQYVLFSNDNNSVTELNFLRQNPDSTTQTLWTSTVPEDSHVII